MSLTKIQWLFAGLFWSGIAQFSCASCDESTFRQFDFWLGKWEVRAKEKVAGINHITRDLDGCMIQEHYTTARGYEGKSVNTYNRAKQQWHQTWIDNGGLLLDLNGRFDGESMVLSGERINKKGKTVTDRITWTPMDDGTVVQHWEVREKAGADWKTLFKGHYHKLKE